MAQSKLRVGVIGLGFFGALHARIYTELPNAELIAIAEVDPARREAAAKRFGCEAYADYAQLLTRDDIHAISICTPDLMHVEPAIAAARAGKAVLLEKPMAHTGEAAQRIKAEFDSAGVRLMVGHVLRFDPRYVHLHDQVARGEIGDPIHVRAKRNTIRATASRMGASTSILYYVGVHDVDVMRWCTEAEITRVYAQKAKKLSHGNEDAVFAVLNLGNGAIGILDYSWAWPNALPAGYYAALELVGTKSAALLEVYDQGLHFIGDSWIVQPDTHLWPEINGRIVGALRDELLHFTEAVLSGSEFLTPVEAAIQAVRVLDALSASIEKGAPVSVAQPARGDA